MLTIIATILPVFLLVGAGYGAARFGLLGPQAAQSLNRFVIWLALPCLLFDVVATTDWHTLWHGGFVAVSLTGSFILFAGGMVVGRVRGLGLGDMAVDGLNASYTNSAYIGLPLLLLVLGPDSRPFVVIAATATLTGLFAAAVLLIELAGSHGHGPRRALIRVVTGMIRNPVLIGPIAGTLWWLTGYALPTPAERFVNMLGSAASPVALVAIGLFLAQRPLVQAVTNQSVIALSILKLAVHPAVTAVLAWHVFVLPPRVAVTAIAIAALPTGTGPFMIAEFYARDGRVTSGTILVSTLLSLVTIAAILATLGPL